MNATLGFNENEVNCTVYAYSMSLISLLIIFAQVNRKRCLCWTAHDDLVLVHYPFPMHRIFIVIFFIITSRRISDATFKWAVTENRFLVKLNWRIEIDENKREKNAELNSTRALSALHRLYSIHYSTTTMRAGSNRRNKQMRHLVDADAHVHCTYIPMYIRNSSIVRIHFITSLVIADTRWLWNECTMQFNDVARLGRTAKCVQRKKKYCESKWKKRNTKLNERACQARRDAICSEMLFLFFCFTLSRRDQREVSAANIWNQKRIVVWMQRIMSAPWGTVSLSDTILWIRFGRKCYLLLHTHTNSHIHLQSVSTLPSSSTTDRPPSKFTTIFYAIDSMLVFQFLPSSSSLPSSEMKTNRENSFSSLRSCHRIVLFCWMANRCYCFAAQQKYVRAKASQRWTKWQTIFDATRCKCSVLIFNLKVFNMLISRARGFEQYILYAAKLTHLKMMTN